MPQRIDPVHGDELSVRLVIMEQLPMSAASLNLQVTREQDQIIVVHAV